MRETLVAEFELVRSRTLELMDDLGDESADRIPEGFRNNLRWHLGHIYTVHEQYIFSKLGQETKIHDQFVSLFGNGSSPEDWDGVPATLTELKNLLSEQLERTEAYLSSADLYAQLPEPIAFGTRFQFNRISELITFIIFHEGNHLGFMKALKKLSV
jgi:uncharacterized damage-inducible protein DinB